MLDVVTFKWGRKYSWEHVRRLRQQVYENLPLRHRFTVVASNVEEGAWLLGETARVLPLARRDLCEIGNAYPKLQVFDRNFPADRVLLLDLDVTIAGNLLPIVARDESLVLLDEFMYTPSPGKRRGRFNTSVALLDVGVAPDVWTGFLSDPIGNARDVRENGPIGSDQAWLDMVLPDDVATFGDAAGIRSYRFDWRPNGPKESDRIICYHGKPKPWDVDPNGRIT
jgi:hypothetical protein